MNTFEGSHFGSYKTYSLLVCEKGRAFFENFSINVMTFHKWFKTTYTVCSNKFCLLKDRKRSRKFKFDLTNFFLVQNLLGHPVAHKIGKIKNNKT